MLLLPCACHVKSDIDAFHVCALACRFYLTGKWHMGNWTIAFTISALALCALVHHAMCGPSAQLSKVVAIMLMASASYANCVCIFHFVRDVFTHKVFTAEKQLNPLMFMRLTHEGLRCAPLTAL
jgi:hypothetical protein